MQYIITLFALSHLQPPCAVPLNGHSIYANTLPIFMHYYRNVLCCAGEKVYRRDQVAQSNPRSADRLLRILGCPMSFKPAAEALASVPSKSFSDTCHPAGSARSNLHTCLQIALICEK